MTQGPLPTANSVSPTASGASTKKYAPQQLDFLGLQAITTGGLNTTLNVTAAAVIKATPGRIAKLLVINPGTTSGALTLNDCATTGAATTANQIFTIAYNASNFVAGAIFELQILTSTGIVVSAVPGGGSPQFVISWT